MNYVLKNFFKKDKNIKNNKKEESSLISIIFLIIFFCIIAIAMLYVYYSNKKEPKPPDLPYISSVPEILPKIVKYYSSSYQRNLFETSNQSYSTATVQQNIVGQPVVKEAVVLNKVFYADFNVCYMPNPLGEMDFYAAYNQVDERFVENWEKLILDILVRKWKSDIKQVDDFAKIAKKCSQQIDSRVYTFVAMIDYYRNSESSFDNIWFLDFRQKFFFDHPNKIYWIYLFKNQTAEMILNWDWTCFTVDDALDYTFAEYLEKKIDELMDQEYNHDGLVWFKPLNFWNIIKDFNLFTFEQKKYKLITDIWNGNGVPSDGHVTNFTIIHKINVICVCHLNLLRYRLLAETQEQISMSWCVINTLKEVEQELKMAEIHCALDLDEKQLSQLSFEEKKSELILKRTKTLNLKQKTQNLIHKVNKLIYFSIKYRRGDK